MSPSHFGLLALLVVSSAAGAADTTISVTLEGAALTSAGIYDSDDHLVRSLWQMEQTPAGKLERTWDGLDDRGNRAAAGTYSYKVVVNNSTYANVGAIGNSGLPSSAANHTPTVMHGVAIDSEGSIYTANHWNEPGADFKKWDKDGKSVLQANYVIRNGSPNGAPYACAVDDGFLYCAVDGWDDDTSKDRQLIERFRQQTGALAKFTDSGSDGHITVYEWANKKIPATATGDDRQIMGWPLRSIVVKDKTLFVADALGGRVLRYNKKTGKPEGEFPVTLPTALAFDKAGQLWVGHEHRKVSIFTPEGKLVREALHDLGDVQSLAFGPDGRLYVADGKAGQVRIFDVSPAQPKQTATLGQKAVPGDRAADRFFALKGVAVDAQGFVVTIQNEPVGGARLARWNPQLKLAWEHFGTMFVSNVNYGAFDPDTIYSFNFHRYTLKDRAKGTWEYTGNVHSPEAYTHLRSNEVHGSPRILKLGPAKGEFMFHPVGDGVHIYRFTSTIPRIPHLVAMVGGGDMGPTGASETKDNKMGKWSWCSPSATGSEPKAADIQWFKKSGEKDATYSNKGVNIDAQGNLWYGDDGRIWKIPLESFNAAGNPHYDWAAATVFAQKDDSGMEFSPYMVQRADDGSVYAFGESKAWPKSMTRKYDAWMGGLTLAKFDAKGVRQWTVKLPDTVTGMDVIPGSNGVIVATAFNCTIYHYSVDGLQIGSVRPGEAMSNDIGDLDNTASLAVNRDPRDGIIDVFCEDDRVLRVGWFRIDDKKIKTAKGVIKLP